MDNEILSKEQLFPDNFAKREILSLTVRCSNPGCTGKMELRHLEVRVSKHISTIIKKIHIICCQLNAVSILRCS